MFSPIRTASTATSTPSTLPGGKTSKAVSGLMPSFLTGSDDDVSASAAAAAPSGGGSSTGNPFGKESKRAMHRATVARPTPLALEEEDESGR